MSQPNSEGHQIWLVRHGQTEWAASGRHTGRRDVPLTEQGRAEARQAGQRLAHRRFALVLVSPLLRARETCRLAGFDNAALIEPDLMEWDYGDFEGRTSPEIRTERPGWNIWTHGVERGETVEQVGERARRVLARVEGAGGDTLLFAHGHLLRILAAQYLGLPPSAGSLLSFHPAAVSVLGWEGSRRVIVRWNERCPG